MKRLTVLRRASQGFSLLSFIYILMFTTHPIRGPLSFISLIGEREVISGILPLVIMILLTVIFGRFFCGWVCPLGTTIDMVGSASKKKTSLGDRVDRMLGMPKFFILGIILLFSFIGIQIAWIFDPMVIMARFITLNMIPAAVLVIGGALFLKRAWCRMLCPLGAIYALAAKFALLRRKVKECTACKRCKNECRMGAIRDDLSYDKKECILCMDCIYNCQDNVTEFNFNSDKS
ncbi:MAG: 4Fe-4S binding protein [Candidatus Omnitrophica bacterium]|nr:4Fe-4S binding protein [Candidatus Omnitrophota bacterium]